MGKRAIAWQQGIYHVPRPDQEGYLAQWENDHGETAVQPVWRMLNGLFFMSGLRGLMGRAKRSASVSCVSAAAAVDSGFPLRAASSDAMPAPRLGAVGLGTLVLRGIDAKDDTATSSPVGERACRPPSKPVNVFAACFNPRQRAIKGKGLGSLVYLPVGDGTKSAADVAKRSPLSLSANRPEMGDRGEAGGCSWFRCRCCGTG